MNRIETYAVAMVAAGAESTAEDDLNEDETAALSDAEHEAARDIALRICAEMRNNPDAVLQLIDRHSR